MFKIADRTSTAVFYRDVLGMKILRHEEFEEGCKAACNGPYDGKWSKSMVGYGQEDNHFVVELTYNYGIKNYKKGNDFQRISIYSKDVMQRARTVSYTQQESADGAIVVDAPGGYSFHIYDRDTGRSDSVYSVSLSVSDLTKSLKYWNQLLGMKIYTESKTSAILGYGDDQARLELIQITEPIDPAESFGRIAFSCPKDQLPGIEQCVKENGYNILTPLVSLDTPGKATVQVVILADPDGHEICFVGDEAFRELSQLDPKADQLLNDAIAADKSDEWFAKKAGKK